MDVKLQLSVFSPNALKWLIMRSNSLEVVFIVSIILLHTIG